jgi:alanine racemase
MTSINSELIIDPKIFRNNILILKNKLSNSSKFMAVIKSDAYGHHIEHIVKDIEDLSDGFGVVRIDEALKIRELSNKKILLMQGVYSKEDLDISIKNKFDLVVHNPDQFQIIKEGNYYEGLWLKLNTGMNRLGFDIDTFLRIYEEYLFDKKFTLMTHLASSNDVSNSSNENQFKIFEDISSKLNNSIERSIANTGCIMNYPNKTYDWVRCGIGIYGGYIGNHELKTAMTLRSPIVNIRNISKGDKVGYDGRAVATKDMKIASVYLGYADGLPVNIKDDTPVMINDQMAYVFGRVSMDLTTIDVSNIEKCSAGDWCEFFSPELPITNIATSNDLISYYLMTSVKSRVKKVYKTLD